MATNRYAVRVTASVMSSRNEAASHLALDLLMRVLVFSYKGYRSTLRALVGKKAG